MAEDDLLAQLERDYCPPLDVTTVLAILSDYDIHNPVQLKTARQSLDSIARSAEAEDGTGFDPSGSSGRDENGAYYPGIGSESEHSQMGCSSYTDDTSLSQGVAAVDMESLEAGTQDNLFDVSYGKDNALINNYNTQLEGLDDAGKEAMLLETFPGLKSFDIQWTLGKCKGDAGLAVDELLHQVFLEDNGYRRKGIEGFSESGTPSRVRKGKGGKKKMRGELSEKNKISEHKIPSPSPAVNKWKSSGDDVDFISSRTNIPPQQINSLYHKNNASLPATINAIIEAEMALKIEPEDATLELHAQKLLQDFPNVPYPQLLALIQITHPTTVYAHELAKALTTRPKPIGGIKIEVRLPPPADVSSTFSKGKPKSHNAVFATDNQNFSIPYSDPQTAQDPQRLLALRNDARSRAADSYRRSKSDSLMSGAASHYASLARDYDAAARSALATEADALVAQQSSGNMLDLHGVSVKDALRIASDGVGNWWVKTGNALAVGDVGRGGRGDHEGYAIITGKGMHSRSGRGLLGPAVFSMLVREGWKVEARPGKLVVTGVVG